MNPHRAIAALDSQIARHGQPIVLRKGSKDAAIKTETLNAWVRGLKADELVGGITQDDLRVTISPSDLAGWPDAYPEKAGYWISVEGRFRSILAVEPIRIGAVLVRVNMIAKG